MHKKGGFSRMQTIVTHVIKVLDYFASNGFPRFHFEGIPGAVCRFIRLVLLYLAVFILDRI